MNLTAQIPDTILFFLFFLGDPGDLGESYSDSPSVPLTTSPLRPTPTA